MVKKDNYEQPLGRPSIWDNLGPTTREGYAFPVPTHDLIKDRFSKPKKSKKKEYLIKKLLNYASQSEAHREEVFQVIRERGWDKKQDPPEATPS